MKGRQGPVEAQMGTTTKGSEGTDSSRPTKIIHPFHLEAISIGSTAASRIPDYGRIGTVHSVFRRVFNILIPSKRLISVVREDVGRGPINIVTNLPEYMSMTSVGVKKNHRVMKVDDSIIVGDRRVIISTKNARRWKVPKKFREHVLTIEKIRDNLATVKQTMDSCGRFDGLGQLIAYLGDEQSEQSVTKQSNVFTQRALPHIADLLNAIRAGGFQDIKASSKELIGLGLGLTPSADDVLSGLMTSLVLVSRNLGVGTILASRVNEEIASCVPGRTTLISQELLMDAAAGEANEPVITLIEKILTADPDKVENATRDVLVIGETSGTDIVQGILLGSQLVLDGIQCLRKGF